MSIPPDAESNHHSEGSGDIESSETSASESRYKVKEGEEKVIEFPFKKTLIAALVVVVAVIVFFSFYLAADPDNTMLSEEPQEDTVTTEAEANRGTSADGADSARPGQPQGVQGSAEIGIPGPVPPPTIPPVEPPSTGSGEHIITSGRAEISVEYEEIRSSVRQAQDIAEQHDGHVQSRDENYALESDAEVRSAITFRIPAENYDEVIERLDDLGDVKSVSETSDDVSDQVFELETRIENAESSLERLREFMEEAENTEELLQVEEQINTRQAELEVMMGQRDGLIGQSELSTLTVVLTADTPADIEEPEPVEAIGFNDNAFMDNLMRGWSGIVAAVNFVFAAFGLLLPYTPIVLIIAVILWIAYRKKKGSDDSASVSTDEKKVVGTDTNADSHAEASDSDKRS